jgi:hypothetical protein
MLLIHSTVAMYQSGRAAVLQKVQKTRGGELQCTQGGLQYLRWATSSHRASGLVSTCPIAERRYPCGSDLSSCQKPLHCHSPLRLTDLSADIVSEALFSGRPMSQQTPDTPCLSDYITCVSSANSIDEAIATASQWMCAKVIPYPA